MRRQHGCGGRGEGAEAEEMGSWAMREAGRGRRLLDNEEKLVCALQQFFSFFKSGLTKQGVLTGHSGVLV